MTHRHAGDHGQPCTEIAPNVCLREFVHSSAPAGVVLNTPEADAYGDHLAGFLVAHDREGFDQRCEGAASIDTCETSGARQHWGMSGTLEGGDLTLTPSILCTLGTATIERCGFHGFVTAGKWVPA